MNYARIFLAALVTLAAGAAVAQAGVRVFACEPEWGALAQEIGGDLVFVHVATTGRQDPHRIQARPSLIARARSSDIAVCTGAGLEAGWMPMIQRQAANPKIAAGAPGAFEAARFVRLKDIPARLDRADGDVHADGSPHIQTDPRNILNVSQPLAERLAEIDPENAASYRKRQVDFSARWTAAIAEWEMRAAPLRGAPIAVQHRNWTYLLDWLGLKEVVALEPRPGVPPSGGHLSQVLAAVKRTPVTMVIRAAYEDGRPSEFLAGQAGIPAVVLPYTVGGSDGAKNLFALYEETIDRLLQAFGHVPRQP